jgi:hypothetical protein
MKRLLVIVAAFSLVAFLAGCGSDKGDVPPKDHFRALTVRLNEVQIAVAVRNGAEIDSLLVPSLRDEPEGVDSLLSFIYGNNPDFQFGRFANYQIFHTEDVARIDADIAGVDTLVPPRRATFTFELKEDSLWFLKRWEPGLPPIGSEDTTEVSE